MAFLDEWITDNVGGWFGDIFLLLCAIGSMIGILLVCWGILKLVIKTSGLVKIKDYGLLPLVCGLVMVLIFGWDFGLEFFKIYPM